MRHGILSGVVDAGWNVVRIDIERKFKPTIGWTAKGSTIPEVSKEGV
jgi:hypothetical protein